MRGWLLGSRNYSFLLGARFLVTFAVQIQAVSIGWLTYEIARDPLALGLVGLAEAAPALGLALFAGLIVDRGNPIAIYRRALLCSTASAVLLWLASSRSAANPGAAVLGAIYAASMFTGAARAFIMPANFALLASVVRREQMGTATAWNSSVLQTAFLSGPPVGGALLALIGAPRTFLCVVALLGTALAAATAVRLAPVFRPAPRPRESPLAPRPGSGQALSAAEGLAPRPGSGQALSPSTGSGLSAAEALSAAEGLASLTSGVRYVWGRQVILGAMALDMFAVLFGGVTAVLPIFARDVFETGPAGLGWLRAALPCGSLLMGWFLIRVPVTRFRGSALLGAVAGFGLCMIGFGLSHSFVLSLLLLAGAGMCDCLSMVMRHTIFQLTTPEGLRGRVAAVNSMFIGSSNEIGAFESGVAARFLGLRPSVVFGGLMTLAVVAATARLAPRLRRLELSRLAGVR